MTVRRYDPPDVFEPKFAGCVPGCVSAWTKICTGCNGAFCGVHIPFEVHACPRRDIVHLEPVQPSPEDDFSPSNGNGSHGISSQGVEGTA